MNFLKENKRFSFKIGEKNVWDTNYKTEICQVDNTITSIYYFENGLKVTNIAKKYDSFGVYEWVNYFENTSDQPTRVISDLWDCDCTLSIEYEDDCKPCSFLPDKNAATKIYSPTGSTWHAKEFYCNIDEISGNRHLNHITPGETKTYSASNGRSSEAKAPFFNIHKNGSGYVFAIGWSGQWNCSVSRTNDTITFKSKIEDTKFCIMPGESFRTSSVFMMPYRADYIESQNLWRRFIKCELSPIGKDKRPSYAPISAQLWGGMSSHEVLKRIDFINDNNIPFDCIWMDAGWYGSDTHPTPDEFEGDWHAHTGDWVVSPNIHPNELKDVSDAIHNSGKKFLLWFEPERVIKTTPIALSHPEYFFKSIYADDNNLLLNLGNIDAWNYCYNLLSEKIRELKIDWLRIDYNFEPLTYWRNGEDENRKGINEIKYINGLYKLLDALLEEFPELMIDDCASGGKRIDIETLKRSVPLWRSDYQCPANNYSNGTQCHTQSFSGWIPYSSTSSGRECDEYRFRSAYSSGIAIASLFSERTSVEDMHDKIPFLNKYVAEAKKVRPYFSEDFYPLTQVEDESDVWCANQFNRPSNCDEMLQIFRREDSPYETACFKLRGLNEDSEYLFSDADGGEFTENGKTLIENGVKITIPQKRTAKILFYKELV